MEEQPALEEQQEKGNAEPDKMERIVEILKSVAGFKEEEIGQFRAAIGDVKLDRVLGCIFGGMIGDALGAYCEFLHEIPSKIKSEVMNMPGGGTFHSILPGQYTDDNEMAYHLLLGLCSFNEGKELQGQKEEIATKIAVEYVRWVDNYPFDIGNTCSAAIYLLRHYLTEENQFVNFRQVLEQIKEENNPSEANGSLMRITPMAAFISLLNLDPLKEIDFIKLEVSLTHPNENLQAAGAAWVYLLSSLINRNTNDLKQFAQIIETAEKEPQFELIGKWFQEAHKEQSSSMKGNKKMGWAKIAFSYGLKFLILLQEGKIDLNSENIYKTWIEWVICRAGDTDTNAAISGGLIGAVIGFKQLPLEYLEKTFTLKYTSQNTSTSRPAEYEPSNVLRVVLNLIKKSQISKTSHEAGAAANNEQPPSE